MSNFTELELLSLPDKKALADKYVGSKLAELRTPALVVDRSLFKQNCGRMAAKVSEKAMKFRVHVKTHKTAEGTRIQVQAGQGTAAVVTSTMVEVWQIILSGMIEEGLIDDILYSMPISADKLEDLNDAQEKVSGKAVIRVMVDHPQQIEGLQGFNDRMGRRTKWSVFCKVDGGGRRAGVPPDSQQMKDLISACLASPHVEVFGFYSHFGQSYASNTLGKASDYFQGEIACVSAAVKAARDLGAEGRFVLSVGATPTAHAAVQQTQAGFDAVDGELELHAGNYCMLDLQQQYTSLISPEDISVSVLTRVVSLYPHRSEAMCDAGALAVSKDTGALPGYGQVVSPPHATGWDLGRVSQEHGVLVHRPGSAHVSEVRIGDVLRVVPQHACLACASYPWYYVVDGTDEVVDVWVPWRATLAAVPKLDFADILCPGYSVLRDAVTTSRHPDTAMGVVEFKNPNFTFHRSLAHRVIPLSKFAKLSSNAGKRLVVGAAIVRPSAAVKDEAKWPSQATVQNDQANDHQILLVQRASNEGAYPDQWELPGGHAEYGTDQTILEAVVREVREETGLQVESIRKEFMGFEYETSKGRSKQLNFVVKVRWEPGTRIKLNLDENQALRWVGNGEWENLEMTEAMRGTVRRALETVAQLPALV